MKIGESVLGELLYIILSLHIEACFFPKKWYPDISTLVILTPLHILGLN